MHKFLGSIFLWAVLVGASEAAIVVTRTQSLEAKITAQDETSVTLTGETGNVVVIPRATILKIYDDAGTLIYPEKDAQEARANQGKPMSDRAPVFPASSIILDFSLAGGFGSFYSRENQFISDLQIRVPYSDGSFQTAGAGTIGFGLGASYQWYSSMRWSSLLSYRYVHMMHTVSAGGSGGYKRESLATEQISGKHSVLFGKEAHFYFSSEENSFDIIGQVGYTLGNYRPVATYSALRTRLSPVPPSYIGPQSVLFHGPTLNLGLGFTIRSGRVQFRGHVYYQVSYTLATEQIWADLAKNTFLHEALFAASVGYGF